MDKDDPDKPPLARVNEMIARSGISSNFTQTDETDISGTKMFTWELQINNKYTYKVRFKKKIFSNSVYFQFRIFGPTSFYYTKCYTIHITSYY